MSTTPIVFDPKAAIAQRNGAESERRNPPQVPSLPVKAEEPVVVPPPGPAPEHLPRSARRELNRLREEVGELRGQLKAYREIQPAAVTPPKPVVTDSKPKREDYKSDAEYAGEVGAWTARQEVGKTAAEQAQAAELREKLTAAIDAKPAQIEALGEDWDKYQEAGEELKVDSDNVRMLFATSEQAVFVGAYFIDHPKLWEQFTELPDGSLRQLEFFRRIEGKAEILYSKRKPAQGSPPEKDRKDSAEADEAGRPAASTDHSARLPRPSKEASAPGGTSVPAEPKTGSAAWIAARNAKLSGRVS